MQVQSYTDEDRQAVAGLFNTVFAGRFRLLAEATSRGLVHDALHDWMASHAASEAWTVKDGGLAVGFISAHVMGGGEGAITTPVCNASDQELLHMLVAAAEGFLKARMVKNAKVVGLTREYGVAFGSPLHVWLLDHGYWSYDTDGLEYVMELDMTQVHWTPVVEEFCRKNEAKGLTFEFLREEHARSLREFPPDWSLAGLDRPFTEDPKRYPFAVCRKGDVVIGYCGTCHTPSRYGQGGWSYILLRGMEKPDCRYRRRWIGAVLLTMANMWLKEGGATFQVLATGVWNRTQRLYRKVGYRNCFVQTKEIRRELV